MNLNQVKAVSPREKLMSPEMIRTLIIEAKDAWVNGEAEAFSSLFTLEGEFVVPGNRWVGRDAIRQVAADFAAQTLTVTIEIQRIIIDGNQAMVEWHWEDINKVTGAHNRADDAIVIDLVNNQISRWREYIDNQTPKS